MDGTQIDGTYYAYPDNGSPAATASSGRVLQIPGSHVFALQACAAAVDSMAPAGATANVDARSFAVVDLGP
jgi:hypothetical protein